MTTPNDLIDMRRKAGRRYTEAAGELYMAFVDLAGIDAALANGNVPTPVELNPVRTFPGCPQVLPPELEHPEFPADTGSHWPDDVARRRDAVIRTIRIPTGD